jgi:ribose 1,5-bisphosphokinase
MGQSAGQLVYVVGPSGAGKDSILSWLEAHGAGALRMVRARRTITRPNVPGAEAHEAVTAEQFEQLVSSGVLAMHWVANGCSYGVRASELAALASGAVVCVNGSRAYLPQAQNLFPGMAVLAISAPENVLRQRLLARGRETAAGVDARLARNASLPALQHPRLAVVCNNASLADAGQAALAALRAWMPARLV